MVAPLPGGMVQFTNDRFTIPAFLARPPAGAQTPAVVVLHEWWGLNDQIQGVARRFAEVGYAALAPDLYARQGSQVTQDPAEAARLMESLSSQHALRDINASLRWLKSQPFVDPSALGVVGFSMGGTLALIMAGHNSDLKASVVFYGKVPPTESFGYLLCPVLFHHAGKDGWVSAQEVERLRQGLLQAGKPGEVVVYPGAEHAFFNQARPEVFRSGQACEAWQRTLRFLSEQLRAVRV